MEHTDFITKLDLAPHPEGGYYRQVFGNDENGEKQISTIYYMLCDNDFSAFHRLHGMTEIWYYHAGCGMKITVLTGNGREELLLGKDMGSGERAMAVIPKGSIVTLSRQYVSWYKVRYTDDDGNEYAGWVDGTYLTET